MTEPIVAPIVGPLSALPPGGSTTRYVPTSAQYSIAIGGLPFQKWPSDEAPYARETADFKRQQIDQSSLTGDQSLVGYWTRGQLSFHRGAGVTYYELSDGDTVLNRFNDSLGVDPWTAGGVTLRSPASLINAMGALDVVLHNGDLAVLKSDGTVQEVTYAGVATAKVLTAGGTSTSICSDGVNVYSTNAAKIDKLTPGGAFATLFTHPTGGRTFKYVWWAKSRLWMLDDIGQLFVKAPTGTLATPGDLLWQAPLDGSYTWSLAESEGSVFLAAKDTIWSSTIDGSAATPVLGGPVVVAKIGAQETIGTIGEYLGYLAVASSAGVRVAKIGDGILLGDLVFDSDASACSRMAFRKSLILATGKVSTTTSLYEFDVLEQVSDLQPAYAPMRSLGSVSSKNGAFVLPDGRVGYFGSGGIFLEGSSLGSASGTIRTGFHRFGTMELKDFRTLSVFATGANGSIGISLVARSGVATPLLTLGHEDFGSNELSLNLPDLTDYIGLEFTLTAVGGVGPTLLGYQLRALPAPKRQRLIQIPLMCFDTERVENTTHGYRGWAWNRIQELEGLEEVSGTVLYQDFDLPETATVQIEKLQFQAKTPPRNGTSGFGGLLVATLRVVA